MAKPFFDRDAWQEWSPSLYQIVEAQVPAVVLAQFSDQVEPGWIEWLDAETTRVTGHASHLVEDIHRTLLAQFAGIRVFHGTRLRSLQDISQSGFVAWDAASLVRLARERFGPFADPAALENAIAHAQPHVRADHVYTFSALSIALQAHDDDAPAGRVPAFSSAGGEWLRTVAAGLGADVDPAPTIGYLFALDIPWHQCSDDTQWAIAQHALTASLIVTRLDRRRFRMASGPECVAIPSNVPPSAIAAFAETDAWVGKSVRPDQLQWRRWPL
ncbi:hypothetical protein [Cognatiluteimonas telluris]|uniref:hypothetical protein n=1 Tax=Cognatiluteimonas telluris TaxID=1104775 RepID=UPI00140ABC37|nr:hypothetical protein [Lysobacter telluris]